MKAKKFRVRASSVSEDKFYAYLIGQSDLKDLSLESYQGEKYIAFLNKFKHRLQTRWIRGKTSVKTFFTLLSSL